jgi:hypothetical protein
VDGQELLGAFYIQTALLEGLNALEAILNLDNKENERDRKP